ncbi:hypothetical protein EMIHUDRAFT_249569 [Emiliania huxleyi CCMP1516]|uniref:Uncharacterized protein n=2 Tax=Emiliania huxleyi TaxID=2903 RepID=A0A0D3I7Z5_EMIH1|nr:hypothetical protein EMIHUDRAFT_249569 [Emiliania huxleyi CCMP1516]EOD07380.1 hypothetical protein EMIHUDRAFT_249569 [Emiliania huxleyi CCMP1516]|eukprot:XP_005759809.1 hypothetical protein EMIHUDRAFT_249569 [Emiliania huxleyi CCMP1516]
MPPGLPRFAWGTNIEAAAAICRPLLLRLVPAILDVASTAGRTRRWQRLVSWRWQRAGRRDEEGAEAGAGAGAGAAPASAPIDRIVLVGGATRMPCIGRFLRRMTGLKVKPSLQPEERGRGAEAVALGAAIQSDILAGGSDLGLRVINPFFQVPPPATGRKKAAAKS